MGGQSEGQVGKRAESEGRSQDLVNSPLRAFGHDEKHGGHEGPGRPAAPGGIREHTARVDCPDGSAQLIQVKTGPRRLDRLHPESGHSMFAARQSFAGTRRRTVRWLVVAWLVFSVSQVFAACCTPAGGSIHDSTQSVAAQLHQDDAAQHDCCDTAEQPCPMMVLDAVPPGAPAAGQLVSGQFQHLVGPPVQLVLRLPAAALADGPARIPLPQVPPGPIYLRLQRFLI